MQLTRTCEAHDWPHVPVSNVAIERGIVYNHQLWLSDVWSILGRGTSMNTILSVYRIKSPSFRTVTDPLISIRLIVVIVAVMAEGSARTSKIPCSNFDRGRLKRQQNLSLKRDREQQSSSISNVEQDYNLERGWDQR
ncbi:hypothetical protein EVAR_16780_1 [Eumeta japonica]|uniref:Uncharacterized protein n=1 Tax=Eumeta variegata TaxID=151549 RepID=A0A4C1ULB2_EUMVA|nr:hypothetical protein EVAR_16780_1 [Eumeta japonica]